MPASAHRNRLVLDSDEGLLTDCHDHQDDSAAESRSNHRPLPASRSLCTQGGLGGLAERFNERSNGAARKSARGQLWQGTNSRTSSPGVNSGVPKHPVHAPGQVPLHKDTKLAVGCELRAWLPKLLPENQAVELSPLIKNVDNTAWSEQDCLGRVCYGEAHGTQLRKYKIRVAAPRCSGSCKESFKNCSRPMRARAHIRGWYSDDPDGVKEDQSKIRWVIWACHRSSGRSFVLTRRPQ